MEYASYSKTKVCKTRSSTQIKIFKQILSAVMDISVKMYFQLNVLYWDKTCDINPTENHSLTP